MMIPRSNSKNPIRGLEPGKLPSSFTKTPVNYQMSHIKSEIAESDRVLVNRFLKQSNSKSAIAPIAKHVMQKNIKILSTKASSSVLMNPNILTEQNNSAYNQSQPNEYVQEGSFHTYEIAPSDPYYYNEDKENRVNNENTILAHENRREEANNKLDKCLSSTMHSGDEMKNILKKIFMFYASFGDRLNADFIKANKIHKMLHDSMILDNNFITKKSLDLLFCKFSKNRPNMSFEIFLSMLIKVAQLKFPGEEPKNAFTKLFENHFKPLYGNLYTETDLGDYDVLFKEPLDSTVVAILYNVRGTFQRIHQACFPLEYQIKDGANATQQSFKQKADSHLFTFLKDFDICPSLLTKSTAYALYLEVLQCNYEELTHNPSITSIVSKEYGNNLTLGRFLVYVARLAILGYSADNFNRDNENYKELNSSDKLVLLLERMEFSLGFINFEKRMNATHNHTTTLLPTKAFLNKLSQMSGDNSQLDNMHSPMQRSESDINIGGRKANLNISHGSGFMPLSYGNYMSPSHSTTRLGSTAGLQSKRALSATRSANRSVIELQPGSFGIFEQKKEFLFRIFQSYASFTGSSNKYRLKSIKFLKFLRNVELLRDGTNNISMNYARTPSTDNLMHTRRQKSWGVQPQPLLHTAETGDITELKRMISPIDIDLIFIRVTGGVKDVTHRSFVDLSLESMRSPLASPKMSLEETGGSSRLLDFEQFLKSLELIAEKLYPEYDIETALTHIIEQHVSKAVVGANPAAESVMNGNAGIKRLIMMLKDPEIVDVLAKLKQSVHVYFKFYADQEGSLNFERFMRFCKDFGIFPDIQSRSKLMHLFYSLATLHPMLNHRNQERESMLNEQGRNAELNENHVIDENLFTEALALCATEIEEDTSGHPIEKIAYLLERMSQSPGPRLVLKHQANARTLTGSYFEVLGYIRRKYYKLAESEKPPKNAQINYSEMFGN